MNNDINNIIDVYKLLKQLEFDKKIKLLDYKFNEEERILDIKYQPTQKIEKINVDFIISSSGFTW